MDRAELTALLVAAGPDEHARLLVRYRELADHELAEALKARYTDTYSSDPSQAAAAAAALAELAQLNPQPAVAALADWTSGMAALQLEGKLDRAIQLIDQAAAQFSALGQPHTAAATNVSKIYALAMLGRYDEAIECGLQARAVFLVADDRLSAGKIELNLGNIYRRRDQLAEAEQFYRAARERFTAVGDARLLAYADNDLANVLNMQHHFRAAEQLYEQALARAEASGLEVTRAEIECNLGSLELFRGRYGRALNLLEQSRRRYAALGMPHESAIAEQELADAYLELNLAPEAAAIYGRITGRFAELGLRAEQARAVLSHARACLLLGRPAEARALLAETHRLFAEEGNRVGSALATLAEAQLAAAVGDLVAVVDLAAAAEPPIVAAGMWGRLLFARWLRGDALRQQGADGQAREVLAGALAEAELRGAPHIAQRCHTSLGLIAARTGDLPTAEAAFGRAAALTEALRMPLPADEFRTAFVADKLTAYTELVRICLADPSRDRSAEALAHLERARARALLDLSGDAARLPAAPRDELEAGLVAQLSDLRGELNWFYSQINRPPEGEAARSPAEMAELYRQAHAREQQIAEVERMLRQHGLRARLETEELDLAGLQASLGRHSALVEYFDLDDNLHALIVTGERIELAPNLARMRDCEAAVEQLQFQIGALRYGVARLRPHLRQLAERANHVFGALYDMLLRPIEARLGQRRLVVVPHRALHYVPFGALYDGVSHLIDRHEVCSVPSAGVLQHCLGLPRRQLSYAVICGVPDARTPHVQGEMVAVAEQFAERTVLVGAQATVAELQAVAGRADVLHLACHGHFRPDNPLFSALELADGQLTVRDAYELSLRCELVTLSACETGVNDVAPGNELLGLARGFISAGAPALVMSLWAVDDESTAQTMAQLYANLRAGQTPAAALRQAQIAIRAEHPHPFYWAPFVLMGRW